MPFMETDDDLRVVYGVEYEPRLISADVDKRYEKEKIIATRLTQEEAEALAKLLNATS